MSCWPNLIAAIKDIWRFSSRSYECLGIFWESKIKIETQGSKQWHINSFQSQQWFVPHTYIQFPFLQIIRTQMEFFRLIYETNYVRFVIITTDDPSRPRQILGKYSTSVFLFIIHAQLGSFVHENNLLHTSFTLRFLFSIVYVRTWYFINTNETETDWYR